MENPTDLQPQDREDIFRIILEAESPSAALLIVGEAKLDGPERLLRYRNLVNQIHPDRCPDRRAPEAFIKASLAYELLCVETSEPEPRSPIGSRWWNRGGIRDLNRHLDFRAAVTQSLCEELLRETSSGSGLERLRACVSDAERACSHLDRTAGYPRSRLWPSTPSQASMASQHEARRLAARFTDLLSHLRAVHRFCPLTARAFDHEAELEVVSPPSAAARLLRATLERQESSKPGADVDVVMGTEDEEPDPLDSYMETLEAQLRVDASLQGSQQARSSTPVISSSHKTAGETAVQVAACDAKRSAAEKIKKESECQRGLQDKLLGDLESEESDLDT